MTATNSPMYKQGRTDGEADLLLVESCPSVPALGPCPPNPDYPVMYMRGYSEVFDTAVPHQCTESCPK